ncbi:MAG TPA: SDR family oxidoreductase [Kofleriaceae bacterium]|nr:SDR family oxidoreductase [Kofleriaceae bacterium]
MSTAAKVLRGRRALVTGASSGIGVELARALARRGADVALTARRGDRLEALAAELRADHDVAADVIALDLAQAGGALALWRKARAGGEVDLLVNNAGFGTFGRFVDADPDRDAELVQLNIAAVVELCHAFAAAHRGRPAAAPAFLMNVASIVAWQAIPNFATYAASKAFVRSFSEALHYELAPSVIVTCLCPGGTHSEFHAIAGAAPKKGLAAAAMMTSADVAERGVAAMLRGKKTVVTGTLNKLSCFFTGLAPRGVSSRAAARVLGPPPAARTDDEAMDVAGPAPEDDGR